LIWPTDNAPIVLVIDDNEGLLQLFQRYLAGYVWQVIGVTDGVAARQTLEAIRPTVIILDVMMPKEDGWAIQQWLKATAATATIPVVICSVLNEPQLAQSLGAAAYLPKPVTQRALLQQLARWWPTAASPPSAH
ncbi:MAG TPA: response regulator, partial [Caldilineaceae bacterium]|nr:response regulator [Caldilineaceae bacterium]